MTTLANPTIAIEKDPNAQLDYTISWHDWMPPQDRIVSVTWTVPAGISMASSTFSTTDTTIWLTGGVDGESYDITCEITTLEGRVDDRTFRVQVVNR